MLLGVSADQERWHVDDLLADADVSLADEDAGMVDRLGEVLFEDLGLQAALHKDLGGKLQDVIQGVFLVGEQAISLEAADQRRSLEQSLGVLEVQSEQCAGGLRKTAIKRNCLNKNYKRC